MATAIITLVSALATAAAGWFVARVAPDKQRAAARREAEAERAKIDAAKQEIRQAVAAGDDTALDRIVAGLAGVIVPVLVAVVYGGIWLAAAFAAGGCLSAERVVFVAADRRITTVTNQFGVVCKAVPEAVFCELLEAAAEAKVLREEREVDRRTK